MKQIRLRLWQAPALRVDLRDLRPSVCRELDAAAVSRLRVWHANDAVELAELFTISVTETRAPAAPVGGTAADVVLAFEGDLARFDRLGWRLDGGAIEVDGGVGHYLGAQMSAGSIRVGGTAGEFVGCEMAGGALTVTGSIGDFGASALPGSMDGMRGGTLLVGGAAGARFGDRMRRGTAVLEGGAGPFLASRMVAGTIAVAGPVGASPGFGMRRGTLVFVDTRPVLAPTFVPTRHDLRVFWQLLARDLAELSASFRELTRCDVDRFVGDLSVDGKGEVLLPS